MNMIEQTRMNMIEQTTRQHMHMITDLGSLPILRRSVNERVKYRLAHRLLYRHFDVFVCLADSHNTVGG